MKTYKYKFSVIIPIYNVEEYLEETIISVINQDIGFKENIQIILVNDGSPDNSEAICLKYKEMYPENIVYVYQDNSGVSAARNNGLNYVEGEFINFLDSDDKWEKDVFTKAYKMYREHDDIDVIGVRQKFFEAISSYPSLDYKFNKDKVVDIFNAPDHIQLSVTSGFFRTSSIGNIRYDTRIKYSEDAKFLYEIILQKEKIGFIASSLHYYRKRFSENSAIQTKNKKDDWYLITPELCYKYVFDLSKKKYGYVIPFVQYYVMYDYQYRTKEIIPDEISLETKEKYINLTKELLQDIDIQLIVDQKHMNAEYKIELISMKLGRDVRKEFTYRNHGLYYNGYYMINLQNQNLLYLTIMNVEKENVEFRGMINVNLPEEDYELVAVINDKERISLKLDDIGIYSRKIFNREFITNKCFKFKTNKRKFSSLYFELVYKKHYKTKLNFITGPDAKIDQRRKLFYINEDKIYYCYGKKIKTKENILLNRVKFSLRKLKFNIKNKKYKVIVYRILYHLAKLFNHKKIWLISDRPNVATDNGFAFFKYINSNPLKGVKTYFVINKNSIYYKEVKKVGKPIIYNSLKYKIYFLLADKIISSQADKWVTNAFGKSQGYYHDLYNADFIFLQHGIIKNDLSEWLNCYEKNIKMFVTSSEREYKSIVNGKYGFNSDIVKLTGLARYDYLKNNKKKKIVIMPTWRFDLANDIDRKTGVRKKFANFNKSEYFNFYNTLINDERLIKVMKENKYEGTFVLHASHIENIEDFNSNDTIKVLSGPVDYSKIFSDYSLLITDYSSVSFDFAYLEKALIYTEFDRDTFYDNQIYKEGYFDDEKDGFGPVVYNYEDTISMIIKYIEKNCQIEKKYLNKIKKFYKYQDKKNSKRICDEILQIDNNK